MVAMPGDSIEWTGGYKFVPFSIMTTSEPFAYSRRIEPGTAEVLPSNLAIAVFGASQEVLINGVLQGRKQNDPKGGSAVSRRKLWQLGTRVANLLNDRDLSQTLGASVYNNIKACSALLPRMKVKQDVRQSALRGWQSNSGDALWGLSE